MDLRALGHRLGLHAGPVAAGLRRLSRSRGGDAARRGWEIARAAWGWWTTELTELVPAAWRGGAASRRSLVLPAMPAELPMDLRSGETVELLLPASAVLQRRLTLPAAASGQLRQAVWFLIPRHTPFAAEATRYAVRVAGRDRAARLLDVEFVVVPRQRLDPVLETLRARSVFLHAVRLTETAGTPEGVTWDFALAAGQRHRRSWRTTPWKPLLAAAFLVTVVGSLTLDSHLHRQEEALRAAVARQAAVTREGAALRAAWQARLREADFLPSQRPVLRPVEVLDALSRGLPDDSWVFALDVAPDRVTLSGYTASVPVVLQALGRVPGFASPSLRTPVTRAADDRQRFDIAVELTRAVR